MQLNLNAGAVHLESLAGFQDCAWNGRMQKPFLSTLWPWSLDVCYISVVTSTFRNRYVGANWSLPPVDRDLTSSSTPHGNILVASCG